MAALGRLQKFHKEMQPEKRGKGKKGGEIALRREGGWGWGSGEELAMGGSGEKKKMYIV